MKAVAAIGIGVACAGLLLGNIMEGGNPLSLINLPAALIIFVGTFGVTMASTSMEQVKAIPTLYKKAFSTPPPDYRAEVDRLVGFAERARREGLLALDDEVERIDDPIVRKGMQLVVDGTDPELVREILEAELDAKAARHKAGAAPFEKAGGFAPTLGVLGTVMGLVHVLENLDDPASLGHAIAGAFIATLYGVGIANVVFLPIANRLKVLAEQEQDVGTMAVEGVLALQAGENPRLVADRLMSFVPPAQRGAPSASAEGAAGAPGAGDDALAQAA
jgi:chemotaxis protein MotA